MGNRYRREDVLRDIYDRVKEVCSNVYITDRPTSADKMQQFVVVRFSQPIRPYADTHNTTYLQIICHVRDRQGGVENTTELENLAGRVAEMFPFSDEVVSCNNMPIMISGKVDGLGFHAVTLQTKIVIKNNSNQ